MLRRRLAGMAVLVAALCACGGREEAPAPATRSPATPAPSTAPPAPSPTAAAAAAPRIVPELDRLPRPKRGARLPQPIPYGEHGQSSWALYLAATEGPVSSGFGGPLEQVENRLDELFKGRSFPKATLDAGCDQGAPEALKAAGLTEPGAVVALYFRTERDARAYAAGLDPGPLAVAQVTSYCLD